MLCFEIIFFIIGTLLILGGIKSILNRKRILRSNHLFAPVMDCKKIERLKDGFMLLLAIHTSQGMIYKNKPVTGPKAIGDTVEIYYDEKKDEITLAEYVHNKTIKGPVWCIIFGILCYMLTLMLIVVEYLISKHGGFDAFIESGEGHLIVKSLVCAFGGLLVIGMTFPAFINPSKRKKDLVNCYLTKGIIVRYRTVKTNSSSGSYTHYYPIYQFYKNGQLVEEELNGKGLCNKIGKEFTIVVNKNTGKAYCREVCRSNQISAVVFFFVAIFMEIVFIICA